MGTSEIIIPKRLDGTMDEYLGKLHALFHDFNELLPLASTPTQELEQHVIGLTSLSDDYSHVCYQILGSPFVPNYTSNCSTLLCVSGKHITDIPLPINDYSALIFQRYDSSRPSKSGKGRTSMTVATNLTTKLIDVMPYMVILLDLLRLSRMFLCNLLPWTLLHLISQVNLQFNEFLKWYEDHQNSGSTAFVAHSSTPYVGLTHSNSFGPWVLDSDVTHHITSNNFFFFFFVYLRLFTNHYHGQWL